MGCASSAAAETKQAIETSARIDQGLVHIHQQESKVIKLLLLGTGESGKSTIFKQMQILYEGAKFSEPERLMFANVIRHNLVESMQILIAGADRYDLPFASDASAEGAKYIMTIDLLTNFWADPVVMWIKYLWREEKAIQTAYEQRSKLQLMDSAKYFFDAIDRIGTPTFSPTTEDILRCRLRTSGIVERTFTIEGVKFKFLDVGGQRSERRKWIHCFEGVTAVIFVAAINEYDEMLYENEAENRLQEALTVFSDVLSIRYFFDSTMILFLNKIDLFQEKIERKIPLTLCFPEYTGDNSLEDASNYIKSQFVAKNTKNDRNLYVHFSCATDTNYVKKVFEAAKQTILDNSINGLGLDRKTAE